MIYRETIQYRDLDGNKVEDLFEFSLNSAEVAEMEVSIKGGLKNYLEKVIREDNQAEILKAFKDILTKSIGRRSDNGKMFLKTEDIRNEFLYSGAYEVMFFRMISDANYAANFVNEAFPHDLVEKMNAGKPVSVNLPSTPVPTPDLSSAAGRMAAVAAAPDFSRMTPHDFAEWQRRQNSPLGL